MTLNDFLDKSDFSQQRELRRVLLLAFYELRRRGADSFSIADRVQELVKLGYARPNTARLKANLKKSKQFVMAGAEHFRIHPVAVEVLDAEYPELAKKTDEVISHDTVIPESLLQKDRTFIRSLIPQINASYEGNVFDGAAVLMRRLLEVTLIL